MTWPLVVLFVAFPAWWLLGVGAFTWVIVPIPMLASLIWRRRVRAPVAFVLWLAFISWVLLSGLQLESGTKIITFSYRLALYAAAGVLFLYAYNLPRSKVIDTKILRILTAFWMIVVAGGYAGILVGAHTFTPPFEKLLPGRLRTSRSFRSSSSRSSPRCRDSSASPSRGQRRRSPTATTGAATWPC